MVCFATEHLILNEYKRLFHLPPKYDSMTTFPKAVLFDLDGLLIDTEPFHSAFEQDFFRQIGLSVSDEVRATFFGVDAERMYADLIDRFHLPYTLMDLLQRDDLNRSHYFKRQGPTECMEGVNALLEELKNSRIPMCVATSSSPEMAECLLSKVKIISYFQHVVTTREAGKSKPFPDVYCLAASKIGVDPSDCVVFEDSPNGVRAAQGSGAFCIAVQESDQIAASYPAETRRIKSLDGVVLNELIKSFDL